MQHERVYHLVYRSDAANGIGKNEITDILKTARTYNPSQNITGVLIFRGGKFLQLLEGEKNAVRALYQKISKDKRHSRADIMLEGESSKRIYSEWSMAFVDSSKAMGSADALWDLFDTLIDGDSSNVELIKPIIQKFLDKVPEFL